MSPYSAKYALSDDRKRSATAVDLAYPHKTLPNFKEASCRAESWGASAVLVQKGRPGAAAAAHGGAWPRANQHALCLLPCSPPSPHHHHHPTLTPLLPQCHPPPQDLDSRPPPPLPPLDPSKAGAKGERFSVRTIIQQRTNWLAVVLFLAYLAATMYYVIVRSTRTMETGYSW
jgi:hypothetical protein